MVYYHCSPISGIKVLLPQKPKSFDKPARVYMTTLPPMALMYSIQNYEYSYGYTKDGQIYFEEYFPDALEILYRGKSASLYWCEPTRTETTEIPNEAVSEEAVSIVKEIFIPDACEALLEQERLGTLKIHRYHKQSEKALEWICRAQADVIRKLDMTHTEAEKIRYYREHYPQSWAVVMEEKAKNKDILK